MTDHEPDIAPDAPPQRLGSRIARWIRTLLLHVAVPAVVLVAGWMGLQHLLATAPTTERRPRGRTARPVEVVVVERGAHRPLLRAMGTVQAARETRMRSRVAGPVLKLGPGFEPGGVLADGAPLFEVDPETFELALAAARVAAQEAAAAAQEADAAIRQAEVVVRQRATALDDARARLRLEEGSREIARRELAALGSEGRSIDRELVLRDPQYAIAQAAVASATAGLEGAEAAVEAAQASALVAAARADAAANDVARAQLELDRTKLAAPFPSWVRERFVEEGAYVTTTSEVATLVGTDEYWIEVLLPTRDLRWISLPEAREQLERTAGRDPADQRVGVAGNAGPRGENSAEGAAISIRDEGAWPVGVSRVGQIVRLFGEIDAAGRMARLLVAVEDPLHLTVPAAERRPLLLGSLVRVVLPGPLLDDVVSLDRRLVRHGDVVWVVGADDTLRITPVELLWKGEDTVLVGKGLESGARVVQTDLGTPVEGMLLRIRETDRASNDDAGESETSGGTPHTGAAGGARE